VNHHHFEGKDIPHIKLDSKTTVKELIEIYANSGFNARQLGEAAKLYQKMIHENATICLTVAGALSQQVQMFTMKIILPGDYQ
jgi:deoxyhypusine synthase